MKRWYCLFLSFALYADMDLETLIDDFVLEVKRIEIPDYPHAFNASMVEWQNFILLSFRNIPNPKDTFTSTIGVVLLDTDFNPIGEPQILQTRERGSSVPSRAEDARLLSVNDHLYIIYSDNDEPALSRGGFRVVVAELLYQNGLFKLHNPRRLTDFEGAQPNVREKSWVPFNYRNNLLVSYSIAPHLVFLPIPATPSCLTLASTNPFLPWDWGIIRGGTPALPISSNEYLSFFHSVKKMPTLNSKGKSMPHYFIGAYTFSTSPPFNLLRLSPKPIIGPGFYTGASYQPYWGSIQCVFPAGLLITNDSIYISYGRQDHEIWIARLDKKRLLESLRTIEN